MKNTHLVFVYGTLKRGFPNHHLLASSKYLGEGKTQNGSLVDLGSFPGFVYDNEEESSGVCGELYEVTDEVFDDLDNLEEFPILYDRGMMDISMRENGRTEYAWVYTYEGKTDDLNLVEDNMWI